MYIGVYYCVVAYDNNITTRGSRCRFFFYVRQILSTVSHWDFNRIYVGQTEDTILRYRTPPNLSGGFIVFFSSFIGTNIHCLATTNSRQTRKRPCATFSLHKRPGKSFADVSSGKEKSTNEVHNNITSGHVGGIKVKRYIYIGSA